MYTTKRQNLAQDTGYYSITNLEDYLRSNHQRAQHFKLDPSRRTTLCGLRGAFIVIPAFCFRGLNGDLPSRYIDVYLTENFNACDIVASSLSTSSADSLLNCAWQFRLEAFQGGQPLELAASIKVSYPTTKATTYIHHQVYKGSQSTIQVINSGRDFDWKLCPDITPYLNSIGDKEYLQFSIDRAGWTTLASVPFQKGRKEMLSVRLTQKMNSFTALKAYLFYPSIGGISFLHTTNYGFTALNVPEYFTARVLIIGCKNGRYWLGTALRKEREKYINVELEPCIAESLWEKMCTSLKE